MPGPGEAVIPETIVARADLADLLDTADQYSYVMVYAEASVDPVSLAERIEREVDKVNALTAVDFVERDRQLALQMGAEIIRMMTIIGVLLAILIVAFTAYSLVARKRRELAAAKILGFSIRQLYGAALCQSLVVTGLCLILALGILFTLLGWLPSFAPQINLAVRLHQPIPLASRSAGGVSSVIGCRPYGCRRGSDDGFFQLRRA